MMCSCKVHCVSWHRGGVHTSQTGILFSVVSWQMEFGHEPSLQKEADRLKSLQVKRNTDDRKYKIYSSYSFQ